MPNELLLRFYYKMNIKFYQTVLHVFHINNIHMNQVKNDICLILKCILYNKQSSTISSFTSDLGKLQPHNTGRCADASRPNGLHSTGTKSDALFTVII